MKLKINKTVLVKEFHIFKTFEEGTEVETADLELAEVLIASGDAVEAKADKKAVEKVQEPEKTENKESEELAKLLDSTPAKATKKG